MWEVYDALCQGLNGAGNITRCLKNQWWTLCETDLGGCGLAMTVPWAERPAMYPQGMEGLRVKVAAGAVKSWNLSEAGAAIAACNAYYNTPRRLRELGCAEPYDSYCTRGLDFAGRTVGVVGHLRFPQGTFAGAKNVFILERAPLSGDYPDSACDFLLPECDVVLITGSALVNKTLPHLLELTRSAYTILTGPTVPLCPALLECGIDRLAGLAVTDQSGIRAHVSGDTPGPPYKYGSTFLICKGE